MLNAPAFDCESNKPPPRYLVLCPRRAKNIGYVHYDEHYFHNIKEYCLDGQILNNCWPTSKLTNHFFMEIFKEEVLSCGSYIIHYNYQKVFLKHRTLLCMHTSTGKCDCSKPREWELIKCKELALVNLLK